MSHFYNQDYYNVFRLPVGWQYLTYNQETSTLNETQFANYNMLVQACLDAGSDAYCEIDIHNYARWDGNIIGQSDSVSDDDFVSLFPIELYTTKLRAVSVFPNTDGRPCAWSSIIHGYHKQRDGQPVLLC